MYLPRRMEGRKGGREEKREEGREGESRSAALPVSFDSQKVLLRKDFGNITRAINAFFFSERFLMPIHKK